MIIKLIIFTIAGMLLYRMLSPTRPLPDRQSKSKEEYTDYEIVEDENDKH